MIKNTALFVPLALAFASLATPAFAADWTLDPAHSSVHFKVKHMMVTEVPGAFNKFSGNITVDDKDPTKSQIDVTIDAASIDTHNEKRDAHLKSPDFFDVAKYPQITFKSTKIVKKGKGFAATGDLTMHGVTKPVTLTVTGPTPPQKNMTGQMVRGVNATGKLNRKDFGLNWNKALEAGGVLVGDEVQLEIDAELVPKAGATTATATTPPPAPAAKP